MAINWSAALGVFTVVAGQTINGLPISEETANAWNALHAIPRPDRIAQYMDMSLPLSKTVFELKSMFYTDLNHLDQVGLHKHIHGLKDLAHMGQSYASVELDSVVVMYKKIAILTETENAVRALCHLDSIPAGRDNIRPL